MRSEFDDPNWREAAFARVRRVCVAAVCVLLVCLAGRASAACSEWDLTTAENTYTNVLSLTEYGSGLCPAALGWVSSLGGSPGSCRLTATGAEFDGVFSTDYHYTILPWSGCPADPASSTDLIGGAYAVRDPAHTATIVAMVAGLFLLALWVFFA